MAASPPRPSSPISRPATVPPRLGHPLQISPNLEALLQHDELTRRNSNSPTTAFHAPSSSEFPISLPPPPPRTAQAARKSTHDVPTTRSRHGQQRNKAVWSDPARQSSSRPATPNPYLNPAPTLTPTITQPQLDTDQSLTPKLVEKSFPNESKSEHARFASEARTRPSPSDPCCRSSNALNKVEKILWMGRDSLSLFSGSGSSSKRTDSDRRNDRAEFGDLDAVQDRQMRQVPLAQIMSDPRQTLADLDTATLSYLYQRQSIDDSASASSPSSSHSTHPHLDDRALSRPPSPTHMFPCLPLPLMPHDAPRPKSIDSLAGNDYLSFIDFFSPSTSDESNSCTVQDKSRKMSSSRREPHSITIPPPSLYSPSCHNISSTSLASMKFAPPSPSSLAIHPPSMISPADSSSSVALSSMIFAPPSPSTDHAPSGWLQPFSGPPSPYSPLEFARPPCSPQDVIDKPTLPTELAAERGRRFKSGKRSISLSPHPFHQLLSPLPPTTNQLDAAERADRIRRNRKLARLFGRVPGSVTDVDEPLPKKSRSPSLAALLTKHKNHRHAVSVSVSLKSPGRKTEPSTPWQTDLLWSPDGRRHSIPLTTGSLALCVDDEQDGVRHTRRNRVTDSPESASTRSFIDLSDEDAYEDDDVPGLGFLTPPSLRHQRLQQSTSTPSLVDSLDSETQAEADRRRKREKVARLHRFLGSRVPPEAIIGNVYGPPLPPVAIPEESSPERWSRRHRNVPLDDFDRGKMELDDEEKALNVRRAQKMEKVFGAPPPQVLFHTRPGRQTALMSQPTSPTSVNPYVLTINIPSSSRNPNQSAYVGKTLHRQGPSDSSRCLLPLEDVPQDSPSSFAQSFSESFSDSLLGYRQAMAQSSIYLNYQHSLNSLVDIIDRDDRKSLVELHRLLHGDVGESPSEEDLTLDSRRVSAASSHKSERRRSLPSKSSMTSLSSEFYAPPQVSQFQNRRRKAAKLTKIFGVDYRELIQDILESIEKGVEDERKTGNLQPQEVEVLMHRVRSLRTMRDTLNS